VLERLRAGARFARRVPRFLAQTLDPDAADYRAMRFEICAFSKRIEQALADAEWLLDKKPEGVNLKRVEEIRGQLVK